jgi:hypothetical protein
VLPFNLVALVLVKTGPLPVSPLSQRLDVRFDVVAFQAWDVVQVTAD